MAEWAVLHHHHQHQHAALLTSAAGQTKWPSPRLRSGPLADNVLAMKETGQPNAESIGGWDGAEADMARVAARGTEWKGTHHTNKTRKMFLLPPAPFPAVACRHPTPLLAPLRHGAHLALRLTCTFGPTLRGRNTRRKASTCIQGDAAQLARFCTESADSLMRDICRV